MSDTAENPESSGAERIFGDFAPALVELTDDVLFGQVWKRTELSAKEQGLITVATLTTLGNTDQLVFPPAKTAWTWSGPTGCCRGSSGQLLETALDVEMTEHLGYVRHERIDASNSRNGTSPKTLHTDVGPVTISTPRDRAGSFEPVIVPKPSRRLSGFDEQVLSLYAKGFTTQDIVDHVADIYGFKVSEDLVTKVTDAVLDELGEWQSRPLDPVWPVQLAAPGSHRPGPGSRPEHG